MLRHSGQLVSAYFQLNFWPCSKTKAVLLRESTSVMLHLLTITLDLIVNGESYWSNCLFFFHSSNYLSIRDPILPGPDLSGQVCKGGSGMVE